MTLPLLPGKPASEQSFGPSRGWAFLRLGFRPFYLGAAVFACLAVPGWIALFLGGVPLTPSVTPPLWHAHEMLFGFAATVIVGFLLTAGKAWTGLATPRGVKLGSLAGLWLTARVTAVTGPHTLYVLLDVLFLPLIAAIFLTLLLRARNRRNLPLAGILILLASANLVFHLAVLGFLDIAPQRALHAALALIVMIECIVAGRIIPAFTLNATPGLQLAVHPRLEATTLAVTAVALALWVFAPPGSLAPVALGLAAALHLARLWRWQPWVTRTRPLLWILHAAYLWLPLGFALLALARLGWVGMSAGIHAWAVGATGGLIIGMITRTARGHTGRPLQASSAEVLAYLLVLSAAVLRVLLPLAAPSWYAAALIAAALAWSAAFALYLVIYAPWLMRTRADGKDG